VGIKISSVEENIDPVFEKGGFGDGFSVSALAALERVADGVCRVKGASWRR